MKSKVLYVLIAAVSMSFLVSISALAMDSNQFSNDSLNEVASISAMTNLEDVKREGEMMIGSYEREEALLEGKIAKNSPRITLNDVQSVIDESSEFSDIVTKLKKIQPQSDFTGGSGVTTIEYWLNESGSKKILVILEQKEIFYIDIDAKTSEKVYGGV